MITVVLMKAIRNIYGEVIFLIMKGCACSETLSLPIDSSPAMAKHFHEGIT